MFELFTQKKDVMTCNKKSNTPFIDAAILYKESLDQFQDHYHYVFKNINSDKGKYILVSKCKIDEDNLNTIGDFIKVEPKYPKIVNKLNWSGLYFSDKYEKPTHITTMFTVKKKHVFHYLNQEIEDTEVIVAIQDDKMIILNKNTRLVDKPIKIKDVWENIKNIDTAIMVNVRGCDKLYIFSGEKYYKVQRPFFSKKDSTGKLKPLNIRNVINLNNSKVWNYNFGSKCLHVDAIVPKYYYEDNNRNKFYLFQNNSYIRYNFIKNEMDVVISDITISCFYLIYHKLLHDLVGTSQEVPESKLIDYTLLIDENVYNIESIITKLCKKKIKVFNKTQDKSNLVLILDKTIGLKEQIIFQYSNSIDEHNSIKVVKNKDERCDIEYKNNCINFYDCSLTNCKSLNIESTFTYNDSKEIKLDISNNFKIDRVLYIETYPQEIDENFKSLWRGNGAENQQIQTVLSNLESGSNNLGIDAVSVENDNFVFYKNHEDDSANLSIKYIDGKITKNYVNINKKYNDKPETLQSINLLLITESPTIENNYGSMSEIDAICKYKNDEYYVFGKILGSNKSRVIIYNFKKQKQISKYAEDVSEKFKDLDSFNHINTVFNLDPQNKMNVSEPILCFILNTDDNSAKVITTNQYINKCIKDNNNICLNLEENKENKKINNILNLYFNFLKIQEKKEINAVIINKKKLYVFRKTVCNIYDNMTDNIHDGKYHQIKQFDITINDFFNISIEKECKPSIIPVQPPLTYTPPIKVDLPEKIKEDKNDNSSFYDLIYNILYIIFILAFAATLLYLNKIRKINNK